MNRPTTEQIFEHVDFLAKYAKREPELGEQLFELFQAHTAFFISLAEHGFSYPEIRDRFEMFQDRDIPIPTEY